jgi:galactokinase
MMKVVQDLFKKRYGHTPPFMTQAPGRLELLGNHTDYNQGLVMSLAVDKYIYMAGTPRNDGQVELSSTAYPETEKFSMSHLEKNPTVQWGNYVKGILLQLRKHGVAFGGFSAAIHGTIPVGAGLSSSAALEVAAALLVRKMYPYTVTDTGCVQPSSRDGAGNLPPLTAAEKMSLAKLCQAAENQFVGMRCGLMDQISSLFGKSFHVIQIDCRDLSVEHVALVGDVVVVVCNSGVRRALVDGEYNRLRQYCESAARALEVKSLRYLEPKQLVANQARLSEREYQCAYHVVGENQRVFFGDRALREDDLEQFGQYMLQSHESSRDFFKNSCPELDLLVELARKHPGCIGARLSGGGFGGATVNLIRIRHLADFQKSVAAAYEQQTGIKIEPMVCRIVDGAV